MGESGGEAGPVWRCACFTAVHGPCPLSPQPLLPMLLTFAMERGTMVARSC